MKSIILCVLCVSAVIILVGCSKTSEPVNRSMDGVKPPTETTPAPDYQKSITEMKTELGADFIVESLPPFVIAGNIPQREFDRFKTHTIGDCAAALYKDYFTKKPDYILKVYLFGGAPSYEAYVKKVEGREPSSPYGYYMDSSKSLIMNIATGGGTLVHEMVHALIKPDFPDVPAWFNEGLGSLYEQCRVDEDGHLHGLINWRYPILMDAVEKNWLVPLKELFSTTDNEFYNRGKGTNYAQARYFCLYMQENKLLSKFYKKFRDNFNSDKTGIKFIEEIFGKPIDEIDKDWQAWVPTVKNIESLR